MSDFDFDEIDRAVNGVIGDEPTTVQATQPVVSSIPEPTRSEPSAEKPELTSPVVRSAPAARRSSGRFMDMVHSSSDMRTRATPAVVPSEPQTPVATIPPVAAPISIPVPDFNNDLAATADDWQKPIESPFLPDTKVEKRPLGGEPIASSMKLEDLLDEPGDDLLGTGKQEDLLEAPDDPRIEASTMPDPLDFAAGFGDDTKEDEVNNDEFGADDSASVDEAVDTTDQSAKPDIDAASFGDLESPEAAVDLDAALDEMTPASNSEEKTEDEAPKPSDEDVLVKDIDDVETNVSSTASPATIETIEEPVGPTSITQQYKEQPSSKQESGAIYDTEAYHQPLAKAPKKRSGALAIVWILLLVLLGAGAGAAFYIYVLPML